MTIASIVFTTVTQERSSATAQERGTVSVLACDALNEKLSGMATIAGCTVEQMCSLQSCKGMILNQPQKRGVQISDPEMAKAH